MYLLSELGQYDYLVGTGALGVCCCLWGGAVLMQNMCQIGDDDWKMLDICFLVSLLKTAVHMTLVNT